MFANPSRLITVRPFSVGLLFIVGSRGSVSYLTNHTESALRPAALRARSSMALIFDRGKKPVAQPGVHALLIGVSDYKVLRTSSVSSERQSEGDLARLGLPPLEV